MKLFMRESLFSNKLQLSKMMDKSLKKNITIKSNQWGIIKGILKNLQEQLKKRNLGANHQENLTNLINNESNRLKVIYIYILSIYILDIYCHFYKSLRI